MNIFEGTLKRQITLLQADEEKEIKGNRSMAEGTGDEVVKRVKELNVQTGGTE